MWKCREESLNGSHGDASFLIPSAALHQEAGDGDRNVDQSQEALHDQSMTRGACHSLHPSCCKHQRHGDQFHHHGAWSVPLRRAALRVVPFQLLLLQPTERQPLKATFQHRAPNSDSWPTGLPFNRHRWQNVFMLKKWCLAFCRYAWYTAEAGRTHTVYLWICFQCHSVFVKEVERLRPAGSGVCLRTFIFRRGKMTHRERGGMDWTVHWPKFVQR